MPSILTTDAAPGTAEFTVYTKEPPGPPLLITTMPLTAPGSTNFFPVATDKRLVVATPPLDLAFVVAFVVLPADYPVGVPLQVVLTNDPGASVSVGVSASPLLIDGLGGYAPGPESSTVFVFDGTAWWTVATTSVT